MWKTTSIVMLALAGCSSPAKPVTEPTGARAPRADEHVAAAQAHARRASALAHWLAAGKPTESGLWYETWQTANHEAHETDVHLAAAADLRATYERDCAGIPAREAGTSPLRHARATILTDDGAIMVLAPSAGPPERLSRALRCHRAWLMLGEHTAMASCPLDFDGLDIAAYGDHTGVSVELSLATAALVPELQRRAVDAVHRAVRR
jgi:hypothetical protein